MRGLRGISADAVSRGLDATLAREIGKALEAIHSIPESDARAAGIGELDMDDPGRKDWFTRAVSRAPRLRGLERAIDPALAWLADLSLPIRSYGGPLSVVHTDVASDNLIVEPESGRLAGILDWTDVFLGDAPGDFAKLVMWRGWEFTEEVLRNYHVPVDERFRDWISYSARIVSTIMLTEANARGLDAATHISRVRNAFAA